MPYGPWPRGASKTSMRPSGDSRPYTPDWPVNHSMPSGSKTAVFRLASGRSGGSGWGSTPSVAGSTRTMALSPPSVIQGAPSGPMITPCGAEPGPSGISSTVPVSGCRRPSSPEPCAVYQTVPSDAAATSCGGDPAGTSYSWIVAASLGPAVAGVGAVGVPPPSELEEQAAAVVALRSTAASRPRQEGMQTTLRVA